VSSVLSTLAAVEPARPAGGAPLWQLLTLTAVYAGGTGGVIWLVSAHRRRRTQVLARAASVAAWIFRVPGWAALPVALATVGLLLAMWAGLYDIGYHVDNGRDRGPLGNPGHLPLLLGLFTTFAAGVICLGLADQEDRSPAWVRITPSWHVPLGGVLLVGCMAFGMGAIALDDVWHRIFGQDVTLWSPTHFVFLCGGILTVIGMLVLLKEGAIARGPGRPGARIEPVWRRIQRVALLGGLLCGLELFLSEFDWGVPLYRHVWQPFLLAVMAGLVLTAARQWGGPGSALGAWAIYALVRLTGILVPVVAGVSASSLPLFLGSAVCVELLALRLDPRRRLLLFGALAGLLCGTVGFASEYGWSQLVMPLPWTGALLPEGLILAALGGLGGGVLGALLAASLRGALPPRRVARVACVGAFALLIGLALDAGTKRVPEVRAHFSLTDVRSAPHREAMATIRLQPRDAAEDANWLYILAWQGGGKDRVVDRLRRVGDGVYRSTRPIPLYGTWKVGLRLNRGYQRGAVPMRLPVDKDLPNATQHLPEVVNRDQLARAMRRSSGAELPAPASFTRPFGDDNLIVLRETKGNVAGWLWALALSLSAAIWGLFTAGLVLGLGRMARRSGAARRPPAAPRSSVVPA
jgi:hypothetical protein